MKRPTALRRGPCALLLLAICSAPAIAQTPAGEKAPRPATSIRLEDATAKAGLAAFPQLSGHPDVDALATALGEALAERERPGLAAARSWIQEHAEFERSVEQVRALYRKVCRR